MPNSESEPEPQPVPAPEASGPQAPEASEPAASISYPDGREDAEAGMSYPIEQISTAPESSPEQRGQLSEDIGEDLVKPPQQTPEAETAPKKDTESNSPKLDLGKFREALDQVTQIKLDLYLIESEVTVGSLRLAIMDRLNVGEDLKGSIADKVLKDSGITDAGIKAAFSKVGRLINSAGNSRNPVEIFNKVAEAGNQLSELKPEAFLMRLGIIDEIPPAPAGPEEEMSEEIQPAPAGPQDLF